MRQVKVIIRNKNKNIISRSGKNTPKKEKNLPTCPLPYCPPPAAPSPGLPYPDAAAAPGVAGGQLPGDLVTDRTGIYFFMFGGEEAKP